MEDPEGRTNFNALNVENATGYYWGVMGLTLNQNGYAWNFHSALEAPVAPTGTPTTYNDAGSGTCHGPFNRS
jgi:P pilus assembly chaperone PapD